MTDIEHMQELVTQLADLAYEALDTPTGERDQQDEVRDSLADVLGALAETGLYEDGPVPAAADTAVGSYQPGDRYAVFVDDRQVAEADSPHAKAIREALAQPGAILTRERKFVPAATSYIQVDRPRTADGRG